MENRPISLSTEPQDALVRRFVDFHESCSLHTITRLEEIYTQDVEFICPLLHTQGVLALKTHMKSFLRDLDFYQRRHRDTLVGEHCAYLSWEMDYAHPRISGGRPVTVRGVSHLKYTTRIYHQEDHFDLGALLYEQLPGLSSLTRLLKRRLLR